MLFPLLGRVEKLCTATLFELQIKQNNICRIEIIRRQFKKNIVCLIQGFVFRQAIIQIHFHHHYLD